MLSYYRFKEINELFAAGKTEAARRLLMELQSRYIAMHDQVDSLKTRLRELEDILYLSKNLEYDGAAFWLKTGKVKQGPFCPECYERDGSLMRMEISLNALYCKACGAERSKSAGLHAAGASGPVTHAKVIQFAR